MKIDLIVCKTRKLNDFKKWLKPSKDLNQWADRLERNFPYPDVFFIQLCLATEKFGVEIVYS